MTRPFRQEAILAFMLPNWPSIGLALRNKRVCAHALPLQLQLPVQGEFAREHRVCKNLERRLGNPTLVFRINALPLHPLLARHMRIRITAIDNAHVGSEGPNAFFSLYQPLASSMSGNASILAPVPPDRVPSSLAFRNEKINATHSHLCFQVSE